MLKTCCKIDEKTVEKVKNFEGIINYYSIRNRIEICDKYAIFFNRQMFCIKIFM